MAAPVGHAAERVAVSGNWMSIVNCAFTSYDPLTGHMTCVGSTLWTGGLTGVTRYDVTGTYDVLTGNSQGTLHEIFRGHDTAGRRGTITFDEQYVLDGAASKIHIDAAAVAGTGGFAGARGRMTFDGTDNPATGFGTYVGTLRLHRAAR
jgi:hypothetical protein